MKICKIIIKDYQQFQDFELDLTYPEGHEKAGEPLEKVCFIGSNGTGKSTLLRKIDEAIRRGGPSKNCIIKYKLKNGIYCFNANNMWLSSSIEAIPDYTNLIFDNIPNGIIYDSKSPISEHFIRNKEIYTLSSLKDNSNDLLVNSLPEGNENLYQRNIPHVTVSDALLLSKNFPYYHIISSDTLSNFWKLLIYLIKKRESDFLEFQKQEENLDKTVRQVQEEFDQKSPKILTEIAKLWDKILHKAGLEFDVEGASNPIQLNDNLQAYIKLKGTDKNIPYSQLSTGIRNFIFRVGHIFTLYFNRKIERGFLLLDEPENSLHPDFLYDLVDIYTSIIQNTQFFVATHNPIIAAQFEPYERFILEFDEQGAVHAKRGTTPVGDDPNDLLVQDFGVRDLLGKEGIKKWERYLELKNLIEHEEDKTKKVQLLEEFLSIGQAYNFPLK